MYWVGYADRGKWHLRKNFPCELKYNEENKQVRKVLQKYFWIKNKKCILAREKKNFLIDSGKLGCNVRPAIIESLDWKVTFDFKNQL